MGTALAWAFWPTLAAVVWRRGHPRNRDMASLQRERRKLDALHNIDRRRRNALARIGEEVRQ